MADFQLNFDDGRLIEILDQAFKSADRLDKKIDDLQANLNAGFSAPGTGAKKLNDSLASSAKSAADADKAFSKIGVTAGLSFAKFNIFASAIEGVGQGVAGFAGNVVRLGAGLESVETNFATYLKSTEKAKGLITDLNKLSADTSFTQNEIFGQGEKLLTFGFAADDVTDSLSRLGDISGGSADKLGRLVVALGQVKARGKLTGEELNQFSDAGLSVDILADALGYTTAQLVELTSKGKIGFEELQKGIKATTDEGGFFFGVMAQQSKTITGLFSTLTGNFEQLQGELGKQLLPFLKNVVIEANNIISSIDPAAIGEAFAKAGQVAAPFLNAIRDGFGENVLPALIRFRDTIQEVIDKFTDFFSGVNSQGAVVEFLKSVIEGVSVAFGALVDTVSFAIDAVTDFSAPIVNALAPAVNAMLRVFSEVVDVVKSIGVEAPKAGGFFSALGETVGAVVLAFSRVVEIIGAVISAILNVGKASQSTSPTVRAISDAVRIYVSEIGKFFAFIGDIINGVGIVVDKVKEKVDGALGISTAFNVVKTEISEFIRIVSEFADAVGGLFDRVKQRILDVTGISTVTKFFRDKLDLLNQEANAQAKLNAEKEKEARIQANAEDDFKARADQAKNEQELTKTLKKEQEKRLKDQQAAAKQRAEESKKEADKAFKLEVERQKLKNSLIEDETEKAIAEEKLRSRGQLKEINDLFKGKKDYNRLIEQEQQLHRDNVAKIIAETIEKQDEADEKVRKRNQDILKQEREFQQAREDAQKGLQDTRAQQSEAIYQKEQELLESATNLYLLKLKQRGASEAQIEKEANRLSLLAAAQRVERKRQLLEQELLDLKESGGQRSKELALEIAQLNTEAQAINLQIQIDDTSAKRGLADFFTDFKGALADSLKIDPGVLDGLLSDAKAGLGTFFDSIKTLSDLQIEQNNRVIESLNERIDKTKEALEKEQADKEKGYANDVSTQQSTLDKLTAQRAAAEQKNRELQAKQVRFQLLQDTAQQVSGIATSVVNIIKGTSAIPFVGIALAAVQVASLFALLASARSQARAATRLYKGGRIPFGKTDENGQTGYMIEDTGVMVGGNEWVINRRTSDEHNKFLHKLNSGKYKGIDLELLADTEMRRNHTREIILNDIVTHVLTHIKRGNYDRDQLVNNSYKLNNDVVKSLFVRQFELQKPDFAAAIEFQVARMSRAAETINVQNTVVNTSPVRQSEKPITMKEVKKLLEENTNRLLRAGFLPLQQLGQRTVGPDGTETHYQIDPSGNTKTFVKKGK